MERKEILQSLGLVIAAIFVSLTVQASDPGTSKPVKSNEAHIFEFPALPYAYDALEPYIDAKTMEIHYDRHHRAYYTNFVNAVKGTPLEGMSIAGIFKSISKQTDAVRNNGGGYFNHTFFWNSMGKGSAGPSSELSAALTKTFGSFEKFKETFSTTAKTRFGSGWAWLYLKSDNTLAVGSTPNQDNPLMDVSAVTGTPLLALDVWEHAYYLKYQNKRADYVDAFWNIVNWDEVSKRYKQALKHD